MKAFETALATRDHKTIVALTSAVGAPYLCQAANTPLHHLVGGTPRFPLSAFDGHSWPNAPLVLEVADILDRKAPLAFYSLANRPNAEGTTPREMVETGISAAEKNGQSTVHLLEIRKRMEL